MSAASPAGSDPSLNLNLNPALLTVILSFCGKTESAASGGCSCSHSPSTPGLRAETCLVQAPHAALEQDTRTPKMLRLLVSRSRMFMCSDVPPNRE